MLFCRLEFQSETSDQSLKLGDPLVVSDSERFYFKGGACLLEKLLYQM
jgi:hypothetical protein